MTVEAHPQPPEALSAALMLDWLEHSPQLLALSDLGGRLLWANRRFVSNTGCRAGAHILNIVPAGADGTAAQQVLTAALRDAGTAASATAQVTWTVRAPSGDECRWRGECRLHGSSCLWTLHDITADAMPATVSQACAVAPSSALPGRSAGSAKKPPATLEAADDYLDLAVELGQIGIWRHDLSSGRILFNQQARALLDIPERPHGWPIEEVRALIHPDDLQRVVEAARAGLTSAQPTDIAARHRLSNGGWRDVLTRRVVQFDAQGVPLAFVGVVLDVTERETQKRLVNNMALRLERTAAAAGVGVWSRDLKDSTGEWSAVTFAMVGRDPALGVPSEQAFYDQIVHPDDRTQLVGTWAELLANPGHLIEHEYRVIHGDGSLRWLHDRAQRESWNGRDMVFGVTLDITQRRRDEDLLHSTTERAALAARGAGIGTWEMGSDGSETYWDNQMFKLRGLEPRAEPPNREERLAMVHRDDVGHVLDMRGFDANAVSAYDFRVRLPNGTYRWLASRSSPLLDNQGRVIRRIGVNWDISKRKQAERDRRRKVVAERESRAKSEFLARMSHELRTPLNAMLGFSELLSLELTDAMTPRQQSHLGHVLTAGGHLLGLIDDVLDLSSLEAGKLSLDLQPVDLAGVIAQAMPLVSALAERHRVSLHDESQAAWVRGDPKRLLQIMLNLLSNAIKYNRPRGDVRVGTRVEGRDVALTVADTGRGLSKEQLSHLFEPFNRLGVESENLEGTGIGLAVVKALVNSMGGSIEVHSRPDEGTLFELRLPSVDAARARKPVSADKPTARARPSTLRRGRLLYIEDNPVNVVLVEELVGMVPGLSIESAITGQAGVDRARSLLPDLILIDMQLPDFDGFEVLRRVRADEQTHAIRCIALSANAMPDDIALALRSGFDEYWTKPIDFEAFTAALQRLFPEAAAKA